MQESFIDPLGVSICYVEIKSLSKLDIGVALISDLEVELRLEKSWIKTSNA